MLPCGIVAALCEFLIEKTATAFVLDNLRVDVELAVVGEVIERRTLGIESAGVYFAFRVASELDTLV